MPVSKAKNRCFGRANLTLSANKKATPEAVLFFLFNCDRSSFEPVQSGDKTSIQNK